MQHKNFHEKLNLDYSASMGSNRAFGLVYAVVFALVGAYLWKQTSPYANAVWAVSASFFLLGIFDSKMLRPLNWCWYRFGLLLHHLFSPVMLAIIFFFVFTPFGWLKRRMGYDPLHLKCDTTPETFWIERDSDQFDPNSYKNQF